MPYYGKLLSHHYLIQCSQVWVFVQLLFSVHGFGLNECAWTASETQGHQLPEIFRVMNKVGSQSVRITDILMYIKSLTKYPTDLLSVIRPTSTDVEICQ